MPPSKSAKHRFERIAFLSSGTPEANAAQAGLVARFGTIDPETADVIVALGGDGLMLQTLHRFMGKNKPIYGMKRGSVGFLMNEFHGPDLEQRLDQAEASVVYPLLMEATGARTAFSEGPEEFDLHPADAGGDNFVARTQDDEPWTPVSFARLADQTPYLYLAGRVTPKTR